MRGLHSLDFSLMESEYDCDYEKVFGDLSQLRHLTLRKPSSIYLTQVQPRSQLAAISLAVPSWPHLRTASIAFKLCDDTPLSPITALANALALSPSLRTFSTIVPSMWTTSIATISSNPSLQRICLSSAGPSYVSGSSNPIPNTGLFMTEARRHPHLAELIVAGTQVLRCRAKTLPSSPVPGSGPSSSLPSSASPSTSCPPSSTAAVAHAPKLRIDTTACSSSSHRRSHSHSSSNAINPAWMAPASASASGSMSAKERKKANRRSARF
ncbi:hypothetical protein H0H93_002720 [Arthromyces matolae]|nr:hypothetical protein H0H93_002720 [Arthromyces matolae]